MMSISTTLFGEISHASLFFTGQLRNPWQMLAEPWGSAEPQLKNTGITSNNSQVSNKCRSHVLYWVWLIWLNISGQIR